MYQEQDLLAIRAQQKKRWVLLGVPALVMLAGLVATLVLRMEVATDVLTLLIGVLLIFGYDMFIKPLRRYERHLNNVLHGRTHELVCQYDHTDEALSIVDGVAYRAMTFITRDEKNKVFERLFYYDAQKPLPDLQQGAMVQVVYHDHELASVTALD